MNEVVSHVGKLDGGNGFAGGGFLPGVGAWVGSAEGVGHAEHTQGLDCGGFQTYAVVCAGSAKRAEDAERAQAPDSNTEAVARSVSPTTGMPLNENNYLPVLVQIGTVAGTEKLGSKTIEAMGIGKRAPWGIQHADIIYEALISQMGDTRLSCLFSDCFAKNEPKSVGPVRSLRMSTAQLREQWQCAVVYAGGLKQDNDALIKRLNKLENSSYGLALNIHDERNAAYRRRLQGVKAPSNLDVDVMALQAERIAQTAIEPPRPFRFFDENPYHGHERVTSIELDWGKKISRSSFWYDEASGQYTRQCQGVPWRCYVSGDERSEETKLTMTFSNIIVQHCSYAFENEQVLQPRIVEESCGDADYFIGGNHIVGTWMCEGEDAPTIYLDDRGEEIKLARGKSFIVLLSQEGVLTVRAED